MHPSTTLNHLILSLDRIECRKLARSTIDTIARPPSKTETTMRGLRSNDKSSPPPSTDQKSCSSVDPNSVVILPLHVSANSRLKCGDRASCAFNLLACISALAVIYRICLLPFPFSTVGKASRGQAPLPSTASAILVQDRHGTSKWTMHIPEHAPFPLPSHQYEQLCTAGQALSDSISHSQPIHRFRAWSTQRHNLGDSYYLDPTDQQPMNKTQPTNGLGLCERSLTFALGDVDASLGETLSLLWMSYGLAKRDGRAFFVDDSNWAYGKYTSYFTAIPPQSCAPPPKHHVVPCPPNARHILISSTLAHLTFGTSFDNYSPSQKQGREEQQQAYLLLRNGYESLFHLSQHEDAQYALSRIADVKALAAEHSGTLVALHIRRGDLRPHQFQFSHDYLPLDHYADAAQSLRNRLDAVAVGPNRLYVPLVVASDDPTIVSNTDLVQATAPFALERAQGRIVLASKEMLERVSSPHRARSETSAGAYVKHREENTGWEGGFYPGLFYAVGGHQHHSDPMSLKIREMIGRAYILDLMVMAESDGVVCAVSSATCRLLGVMMGWEAISQKRWVNIDDGRKWSWDGRR